MLNWLPLEKESQLDEIVELSKQTPCLLFKHSTRCSISHAAKLRLEDAWTFAEQDIKPYYLDLLNYRSISNAIAERFAVHHESPQVLLIYHGDCIYDASHMDINAPELAELLETNEIGK